jgi:DnaJ-class molecular chaperone
MAQPEFQDYYKTLGVQRGATAAEIKKAFRKLARESHPDKHPGDSAAERRFKAINEANAVLSDPAKRSKYDQFGRDWEAYARAGAAGGARGQGGGAGGAGDPFGPGGPFAGFRTAGGGATAGAGPGGVRFEFRSSDGGSFSDFFHMMFGDESAAAGEPEIFSTGGSESIDDLLQRLGMSGAGGAAGAARGARAGAPGSGQRVSSTTAQRRKPIEVTAEISLEESFHGTTRIVELDGRRLEITIPRGAATGSRIRLTGKAPQGQDLIVVTKVKPHPVFTRKGDDLEREVPVTLREALLGGEVPVGTLKGKVLLKIPPGTQHGRVFRLKGQGMPRFKGDGAGDLLVRVRVVLPTNLSDAAKAAAERFLDLTEQPDPRA